MWNLESQRAKSLSKTLADNNTLGGLMFITSKVHTCKTESAPFLPYPEQNTTSRSGFGDPEYYKIHNRAS